VYCLVTTGRNKLIREYIHFTYQFNSLKGTYAAQFKALQFHTLSI